MAKTVSMKRLMTLHEIKGLIEDEIEQMKNDLKEGATPTCTSFGTYTMSDSSKSSYSKDDKERIDKWAASQLIVKKVTKYKKIDLHPSPKAVNKAQKIMREVIVEAEDSAKAAASAVAKASK